MRQVGRGRETRRERERGKEWQSKREKKWGGGHTKRQAGRGQAESQSGRDAGTETPSYHLSFFPRREPFVQLEVGRAHHGLLHRQVRQQVVVLHDVARHLAEGAQVTLLLVHQDGANHVLCPREGTL